MASELSANNPDLIESLRRNAGNQGPTNPGNNPPSGTQKENDMIFPHTHILLLF